MGLGLLAQGFTEGIQPHLEEKRREKQSQGTLERQLKYLEKSINLRSQQARLKEDMDRQQKLEDFKKVAAAYGINDINQVIALMEGAKPGEFGYEAPYKEGGRKQQLHDLAVLGKDQDIETAKAREGYWGKLGESKLATSKIKEGEVEKKQYEALLENINKELEILKPKMEKFRVPVYDEASEKIIYEDEYKPVGGDQKKYDRLLQQRDQIRNILYPGMFPEEPEVPRKPYSDDAIIRLAEEVKAGNQRAIAIVEKMKLAAPDRPDLQEALRKLQVLIGEKSVAKETAPDMFGDLENYVD